MNTCSVVFDEARKKRIFLPMKKETYTKIYIYKVTNSETKSIRNSQMNKNHLVPGIVYRTKQRILGIYIVIVCMKLISNLMY